MKYSTSPYWIAGSLLFTGVGAPCLANAQTAEDANSLALEEIIVTARRVEENIMEVPASVTALTAEDLQDVGSLQDISGKIPGLVLNTAGGNNPIGGLRGQGNRLGAESVLGVFEDGVALPKNLQLAYSSLDTARIEVTAGPQSALYGRSTLTGAINIVTNDPTEEFTGFAEAGFGGSSAGSEDLWHAKAAVSGPILGENLMGGLSC